MNAQCDVLTTENTASSTRCIILEVDDFGDNPGTSQQLPKSQSDDVCMDWWRLWGWSFFNGHRLPPSSRTIAKYSREAHIVGVHAVDAMELTTQLPTNDNEMIIAIFPVNSYLWEILVLCDFLAEFTEHVTSLGHHVEQDYYPGKPSKADVNKFGFSEAIDSSIKKFAMRVALARKVGSGLDAEKSKVVSTYLNWVRYHGCHDTVQRKSDHLESWEGNVGFDTFRIGSIYHHPSSVGTRNGW